VPSFKPYTLVISVSIVVMDYVKSVPVSGSFKAYVTDIASSIALISSNYSLIPNCPDKSPSPNLHSLILAIISGGKKV